MQCPDCKGSGCAAGSTAQTCSECGGSGQVRMQQRTPFGISTTMRVCPKCGGKGKIVTNPCKKCSGSGQAKASRKVEVSIPAGVDDGQILTMRGQGNVGVNGGPNGDVLVDIIVRPHPLFRREGYDIFCEVPITYAQAALGDELTVPTIDGKVSYKIPEGTQPMTTFRLKGKGIPYVGYKNRGDQYVTVVVETPTKLTKEQKELLRQLEDGAPQTPKRKKFFDTIKDLFD